MTAAGRNIMKLIVGSALGSAVATVVAKMAERDDIPVEDRVPITESVKAAPERLRTRWERAKAAGAAAEAETTAHLTEIFRAKVNDPDALKDPDAPSR